MCCELWYIVLSSVLNSFHLIDSQHTKNDRTLCVHATVQQIDRTGWTQRTIPPWSRDGGTSLRIVPSDRTSSVNQPLEITSVVRSSQKNYSSRVGSSFEFGYSSRVASRFFYDYSSRSRSISKLLRSSLEYSFNCLYFFKKWIIKTSTFSDYFNTTAVSVLSISIGLVVCFFK